MVRVWIISLEYIFFLLNLSLQALIVTLFLSFDLDLGETMLCIHTQTVVLCRTYPYILLDELFRKYFTSAFIQSAHCCIFLNIRPKSLEFRFSLLLCVATTQNQTSLSWRPTNHRESLYSKYCRSKRYSGAGGDDGHYLIWMCSYIHGMLWSVLS